MWGFVSDVSQRPKNWTQSTSSKYRHDQAKPYEILSFLYTWSLIVGSQSQMWWNTETQKGFMDTVEVWGSREDIWGLFRRRMVWSREGESLNVYSSHHVWISLPLPFHLNKARGSSTILGVVLNVRFINRNAAFWMVIYIWPVQCNTLKLNFLFSGHLDPSVLFSSFY